jgi:hypothetical protein
MPTACFRKPAPSEQAVLNRVEVTLLGEDEAARARFDALIVAHHYLKSSRLVGERLRYVAQFDGQWVALVSWSAAAYHLKDREDWLGWSDEQRRRRLALVANNSRFLILPGVDCPNLASRVLALNAARLSADWERVYGHPILAVESFVDRQLFRGTCYKAQGWTLLGQTRGFGRQAEDYYTAHERPKQLWVRALQTNGVETLRAEVLPASLQAVEQKVMPRSEVRMPELHALVDHCRQVPDWRGRKGRDYPLPGLLAMIVLATLCDVVRGQRDLAAFASGLSQAQLRALLCRKGRDRRYPYPKETTFFRVLTQLNPAVFERALNAWVETSLGPRDQLPDTLIAIDGKAQRGSTPHCPDEQKAQLVSAVSLPSGRCLGTELVETKSNEIPAARTLLAKVGPLDRKVVMLDALHTNQETLRIIKQEQGADFLLPVKDNHEALRKAAEQSLPARTAPPPTGQAAATPPRPPAPGVFPPGAPGATATTVRYRRQRGNQLRPARKARGALGRDDAGKPLLRGGALGGGNHPCGDVPHGQEARPAHLGDGRLCEQPADDAGQRAGPAAADQKLLGD